MQQILSVDVSNWTAPRTAGKDEGKSASELTRSEVIEAVWDQVKRALEARTGYAISDAARGYAFVDDDIQERLNLRKALTFQRSRGNSGRSRVLLTNAEPLLVNQIDTRKLRPAAAGDVENAVLASDYVRTETDLATMEGANEAARRAVNAILARENRSDLCRLFPLEEPFEFLRVWDRQRFQASLPPAAIVHVVGVLLGWSVKAALLGSLLIDGCIRVVGGLFGRPPRLGEVASESQPVGAAVGVRRSADGENSLAQRHDWAPASAAQRNKPSCAEGRSGL